MPTVYVETSVPSFYHTERSSIQARAWSEHTRQWWRTSASQFELFTSEAVLRELQRGRPAQASLRLAMMSDIPLLPINDEVVALASAYIRHRLMPADDRGDALHLAIASFHGLDYLLTWNCKHLANPNKAAHLAVINERLGMPTPTLVTPYNLT